MLQKFWQHYNFENLEIIESFEILKNVFQKSHVGRKFRKIVELSISEVSNCSKILKII